MIGYIRGAINAPALAAIVVLAIGRPFGAVLHQLYRHRVILGVFPTGPRTTEIPGDRPVEVTFIGSVAVVGYGVLRHEMTAVHLASEHVAVTLGRACRWVEISAPALTVRQAARHNRPFPHHAAVTVVLLGITDVLTLTHDSVWTHDLSNLIERVRTDAGTEGRILIAGIPPLHLFTDLGPIVTNIIRMQVDRLNNSSARIADAREYVTFSAFPTGEIPASWRRGDMSWRQLHSAWAASLGPEIVAILNASTSSTP